MKQNKNKNKILSIRVSQDEYDNLLLLTMINNTTITEILRGLFLFFIKFDYKKQDKLCKLVINNMISKNK